MPFDIVLPAVVTLTTIAVVLLYGKFENKMKSLFEEKEFRIRDSIFLVIGMGIMVTIIALAPQLAIQILFIIAYSFVLFLFTFIASDKWYLAVMPPTIFLVLYLLGRPFWNFVVLDIFAIVFAVFISIYMGGLFSWKSVLVFALLITCMDVIQVLGTGFMGDAATKFVALELPVLIQVPTFPFEGAILLGLGDIFLTGLMALQLTFKYGKRAGVTAAISTGFAFLLFEIALFNLEFAHFFPATIVVILGWLLGYGIVRKRK